MLDAEPFRGKVKSVGAIFRSDEGLVGFGTYDINGIDILVVFADFILQKAAP